MHVVLVARARSRDAVTPARCPQLNAVFGTAALSYQLASNTNVQLFWRGCVQRYNVMGMWLVYKAKHVRVVGYRMVETLHVTLQSNVALTPSRFLTSGDYGWRVFWRHTYLSSPVSPGT